MVWAVILRVTEWLTWLMKYIFNYKIIWMDVLKERWLFKGIGLDHNAIRLAYV